MWEQLGEPILPVLQGMLDANWLRQQVIANNIANVDTPQYKRWDVVFAQKLKESSDISLARTNPRHIAGENPETVKPSLIQPEKTSMRNDGNNVDLEYEMALQAETVLLYNLLTRLVSDHLGMLRTAITEGRR
ncbi:MAG TPA: flagellar basal body rod protein FlgB [Syntrophomonadaceae bacterium]|nr:flagellar basal body rod protein FlgB [Syntrophomonadaceae bacterium]